MAAKVFMQAVDEGLTVRSMLINSKVLLSELKMCLFSNPGLCSLQNRMNTELPKHVIYVCTYEGCKQRNARVTPTRGGKGAEDLHLQEDVVPRLQVNPYYR